MLTNWNKIIFSHEKKFYLDGPGGFSFYWHDLRQDKMILSKSTFGGGSLMAWASIIAHGKSEFVFINDRLNSEKYQTILENHLLPLISFRNDSDFIFKQDNAPVHTARSTHKWFEQQHISVLEWPANSPDLNIIENVWGIISRDIYGQNKTYHSIPQLKEAILRSWEKLDINIIQNLYKSMPNRIYKLIEKKGRSIGY